MLMISCLKLMILVYFTRPKFFLSNNFDIKDIEETTYMIMIEILWDRSQELLRLLKRPILIKF